MRRLLNWLSHKRFPYEPLITVTVSRSRILHNLKEFSKLIPEGYVVPVLKSNAYGHGLFEVAKILSNDPHIPFFAVDSYFEAVALRARRIKTPLLIIGYNRSRTIMGSNLKNTAFAVTSLETLKELKDVSHTIYIHLKFDTGMRRQGLMPAEMEEAIGIVKDNPYILLRGIATHFCDADNADESFTEAQIASWNSIVKRMKIEFPDIWYAHAAATDGSRFSCDIRGNVVRLGIGLYGLSDNEHLRKTLDLQPALEMRTIITGLKDLKVGETVGYGNTFKAPKDMRIATIPVGYFEGLDRRMSNNGSIQVGPDNAACPIVGRVSMNITTIDVTDVPSAANLKIGSPVKVISNTASDPNSITAIAKRCGTISYEIAVRIPAHLKRVVID